MLRLGSSFSHVWLLWIGLLAVVDLGSGRGIDVSLCDDKFFNCECGTPKRYTFQLKVKQCTYFYRWKPSCKPCDDKKEAETCALYKQCQECQAGIDQCVSCPLGKYGLWCAGDCMCQNGAECDQKDGACKCPPGFGGKFCEQRIVLGCDPLGSVPQLQWDTTSAKIGDVATARCASGYAMMGSKTRTCTKEGVWTGELPTCERICPFPKLGAHLRTKVNPGLPDRLLDADSQEVAKEIEFECDPGYALTGPHRLRCQSDGTWDQEPPSCKPKLVCPDPGTPTNGGRRVIDAVEGAFAPGTQIKFSCNETHFLDGSETLTCTVTGKWSSALPQCLPVTGCPPPIVPKSTRVDITKPVPAARTLRVVSRVGLPTNLRLVGSASKLPPGYSSVGSRALYSCESIFYRLQGTASRVCLANGQWSGQDPSCEAICGQSPEPKRPSIINGKVSDLGKWPWQVAYALRDPKNKLWVLSCGGSLLSESFVLTAAHCVTKRGSADPQPLIDQRVYLGKHFRMDDLDDAQVLTVGVEAVFVHPNYHPKSLDSDIALVKLLQPVKFTSRIQPVCMPTSNGDRWMDDLAEGTNGTVTGWGYEESGLPGNVMKETTIPVVDRRKCANDYRSVNISVTLTTNMFCAGYEQGGTGTCKGDSGGPFVIQEESNGGSRWVLEGIVSWGGSKQCAVFRQYSGFLRVANFADWIQQFL